jgi:hypothetical protein
MRRIGFAALIAFALAIASVAPTFAESGGGSPGGKITVWCSVDSGTRIDIHGSLIVPDGSHGKIDLLLVGSKDGKTWKSAWDDKDIHVVTGQTSYGFVFDGNINFNNFAEFRVIGDGTYSRVINRDECGFRVPEAPASALLLLGALPAGLIAIKATGVRLPVPNRNRIV